MNTQALLAERNRLEARIRELDSILAELHDSMVAQAEKESLRQYCPRCGDEIPWDCSECGCE